MPNKPRWDQKSYRATWEDCDSWVQAFYEDFGYQVSIRVCLVSGPSAVHPAVAVSVFKPLEKMKTEEKWYNYLRLDIRAPHHAEHCAVQLLSRAWLDVDGDRQRAERQAPVPLL